MFLFTPMHLNHETSLMIDFTIISGLDSKKEATRNTVGVLGNLLFQNYFESYPGEKVFCSTMAANVSP